MSQFPELPDDEYAAVHLEDTDRPLPEVINPSSRYAYFKTIAKGGKAIIQSCKDLHLSRVVCYKTLKPEYADDPVEQIRFLREARVTAALQHPGTVPTYELGRNRQGHYYFTMKLVHGFTLRELFHEKFRDRYDLMQLVDVLIQVANALRYAHSHRVIHRDIKPENVLVGPFGEVLLMDWGLAKVWTKEGEPVDLGSMPELDPNAKVSSMTGHGQAEGTIAYMSPEQIQKDPDIDYRTDLYSMGVVLYETLARRTPYQAETVREMAEQITGDMRPPKPSEVTSDWVPAPLEELAMRCIQKDPAARISGCEELIRRLESDWR